MKILVISVPGDRHAEAVVWGLEQFGLSPVVWKWSDFPRFDKSSIRLKPGHPPVIRWSLDGESDMGSFDVVWMRRRNAVVPMDQSHPDDIKIIKAEAQAYIENVVRCMGRTHTRWINDVDANGISKSKLYQLIVAQELGFDIPDTLMGNNPEEIRSFHDFHGGKMVYKAFKPGGWREDDGGTNLRTSLVERAHLESDYAMGGCPGIYQPNIEKKHELRVTVMGTEIAAAIIDSQRDGTTVDSRYDGGRGITNLRMTELSPGLATRCIQLCRRLGLEFGCIDLIVGKDDRVTFLEVNSDGQFLWKELADPRLTMLDSFCRFVAKGHAGLENRPVLRMQDFFAAHRTAIGD